MREGDPAGAEDQIDPPVRIDRADDAGRELGARLGPAGFPVERDPVLVRRPRFEPLDADQRIVVALDPEGGRAMVKHLDLTGVVGLHPDDRLGVGDVAKDRTQDQLRHPCFIPDPAWVFTSEEHPFGGSSSRLR
jgi:hypothetical protein